jgi:hypothetical protein
MNWRFQESSYSRYIDARVPYGKRTRFGAPKAYVTGENQFIPNTLWLIPHRGHSSWLVIKKAYSYFWRARSVILSFASLPVIWQGKPLAVVNIHCKRLKVLGKNPEMLVDFLIPFLVILGYIMKREEKS